MLPDLFTSLAVRCSPYVRYMGYLDEAIAMRRRHRKRSRAWQPHLDKSRRFVLSTAEKCTTRNKAVVLGSGILLDLPLAELASLFQQVILVDIVCLPQVRKEIKNYSNVTFVERDITNIAEKLYRNKQERRHDLPDPAAGSWLQEEKADLVVSLNILSQLWVVPRSYVLDPLPYVAEEQLDDWCRRIVEDHCATLRSSSSDICLLADFEFVKRDREGTIISSGSTVGGLTLPRPDESWTWHIEPLLCSSQFHSRELTVGAWHIPASPGRKF